jgi:hypothetical protein
MERISASAVIVSPINTGAVNFQFWLRNTVPGPGMSIATNAWSKPVVSPPCTTSFLNLVLAVKAFSCLIPHLCLISSHQILRRVRLFANLSFTINKGARIGLVGPNGVGKTTLLRIIAGEDEASSGSVSRARGVRSGYLSQEADFKMEGTLWDACHSVFDDLIKQQEELHRLEDLMATDPDVIERYGKLQEDFERRGGYTYETRIKQVLTGSGI